MKKVSAVILATSLAFSVSGQVAAEQIKEPAPIVQNVDVQNIWKSIDNLKASVVLQDEKYTVAYDEKDGIVNVKIKKQSGKEEIEVTGEEANKRVVDFVKGLGLSTNLSKEEFINRLSDALGVEPSEVKKADAKVIFTNKAHFSFSYKKGEKAAADPYKVRHLKVHLKANDGTFYNVHLLAKDPVKATFVKKTKDGVTVLKNSKAQDELIRIKDELIPAKGTTWDDYVTKVSDVLGIEVTDITKADVQLQFENNSKVDAKFHR